MFGGYNQDDDSLLYSYNFSDRLWTRRESYGKSELSDLGIFYDFASVIRHGRFLYVGVRDFGNSVADAVHRYEVRENGTLVHQGKTDADAIPWGLQISPDGQHLLVTAAHGETLTAFKIDEQGNLDKVTSIVWGKMIRDIAVVVCERE